MNSIQNDQSYTDQTHESQSYSLILLHNNDNMSQNILDFYELEQDQFVKLYFIYHGLRDAFNLDPQYCIGRIIDIVFPYSNINSCEKTPCSITILTVEDNYTQLCKRVLYRRELKKFPIVVIPSDKATFEDQYLPNKTTNTNTDTNTNSNTGTGTESDSDSINTHTHRCFKSRCIYLEDTDIDESTFGEYNINCQLTQKEIEIIHVSIKNDDNININIKNNSSNDKFSNTSTSNNNSNSNDIKKYENEHLKDNVSDIQLIPHSLQIDKSLIYKVAGNVTFDNGTAKLKFAIWMCEHLPVDKKIDNNLKQLLRNIGQKNNDYRKNEPIQNVIDPELYAYRLDRNVMYDQLKLFVSDQVATNNLNNGKYLRGSYQWISTIFKENRDIDTKDINIKVNVNIDANTNKNSNTNPNRNKLNKITIVSPIHNIGARNKNKSNKLLYESIEQIFESMLPLFNQFSIFKNRRKDEFKVIVKSQRYAIGSKKGYYGDWHCEGLTENIIIVGIYYFEWYKGLTGGQLKFRNQGMPSRYEMGEKNFVGNNVCTTYLGKHSAIVFDNIGLIHRNKMMRNNTINDKKVRKRGFLAFFIIDPRVENNVIDTRQIGTLKRHEYIKILDKSIKKCIKTHEFGIDLIRLVVEYGNIGMTLEEAKKYRNDMIGLKQEVKGRWGSHHYGNYGYEFYFPMGNLHKFKITQTCQTHGSINQYVNDVNDCAFSEQNCGHRKPRTLDVDGEEYIPSTHSDPLSESNKSF